MLVINLNIKIELIFENKKNKNTIFNSKIKDFKNA